MTHFVILGAGTAGTIMANRLARQYRRELRRGTHSLTVVDPDPRHVYQPGLLFVPFGVYRPEEIVRPRAPTLPEAAEYVAGAVDRIDLEAEQVVLEDGRRLPYHVLVIATGTRIVPEETEGLTGAGWGERVFDFYTVEGAAALARALERFEGGQVVVNVVDMPIKCPVAPLEFVFLADWFFTERGLRDRVTLTYVTPLDGAFTKPIAASRLAHLLRDKGVELVTEFNTGRVDGETGTLVSWDDREVPFDLLVTVPLHAGAEFVGRTGGLGNDLAFVRTDPATLRALAAPNVFALGDATDVPASKAGSVAHFQSEVVTENIARYLAGRPLEPGFDGHANCFVETGHGKALLIDFNYEVEPLPGKFPVPVVGPMTLLRESRLNHLGKMAFRWIYWNLLLPGRDLPGIGPRMPMRGKRRPTPTEPTMARAA